jgi:glycosyltransferase involved in cell wall biosynthesis
MNKKLSIITINFNNLEGLKRTVESVFYQTWLEFEYIVIDGGSDDGSAEYIESQSKKIDYWISEPDKGIYNAMNKGIDKSSGEYLLFLNSGDRLTDNSSLKILCSNIGKNEIIFGNIKYEHSDKIITMQHNLDLKFFLENSLGHAATLIKRNLFDKNKYNEKYKIVSDWEFFVKMILLNNAKYFYVNQLITIYQGGGISVNSKYSTIQNNERYKVLNNLFPHLGSLFEQLEFNKKIESAYFNNTLFRSILRLLYYKVYGKHYNI